ncbi:MAG: hypothetical protein NC253_04255 [Ruminococcus sp.]|nr:hypothetical protein [Ruminococcus sp.]MCM1380769.1 hypothetical protein [Muribaculaceae bacterium]MCM1478450.1 hypothetical protein [Muribaculaceae bacterium]
MKKKKNYKLNKTSICCADVEIYFDETFEKNSWVEYGLLLNHEIYMEILDYPSPYFIESLNIFLSFLKYVCEKTDSDILSFWEGGIPLLHRKNKKILIGVDYYNNTKFSTEVYGEPLKKFLDGLTYEMVDIDKHFGL